MAYSIRETDGRITTWHCNSDKPQTEFSKIISIQADGDELELIRKRFQNTPICFGICIWKGEMANFIYDNL